MGDLTILQTIGISALTIYLIFVVQFLSEWFKIRHIPSALPLPIIGHLYMPGAVAVMKFLSTMKKKYGPIFAFWSGNAPFVVVSDPKSVRQILTEVKLFIKGNDYQTKFAIVFGQGLVTSNGERHKRDRQCLAKYFVKGGVERYLDFMNSETLNLISKVLEPVMSYTTSNEINVTEFFHVLALRVFGKFAADHCYETDPLANWINHEVSDGSYVIGEHIVLGLPVWNFIPRIKRLKNELSKFNEHLEELISGREKQRKEPNFEEPDDPMKAMLDAGTNRKEMYEQFTTLIAAGHDTTAFFGCYMCYLLATHPEVQTKLKTEIKGVMNGRLNVTAEDIKAMPYLSCVMKEVLRMYTVIPFVNRTTTQDVLLRDANIVLPKGTTALIPLCIMNRDGDVWDEPNKFKPERFEVLNISDSSAKHGFLPFGYGSRTCIGNTLALTEGAVMFSLLLQKCTFSKVEGFKPKIAAGISLVSQNGIRVICVRDRQLNCE
ncbi:hypothetical protein ScalyP_jg2133 [Parmales sp. scaly parma]|nr:hypothetical protein ScalyP_jg2133 [Parmales sp. scaly parma]